MKKILIYAPIICMVFFLANCTDINSLHDVYLENGETIYIAKVDSVDTFSGDKRVLLRLYSKGTQTSTFAIFWNQRNDSLIVPVQNQTSPGYFDVMLGNSSSPMDEKSFVFEIFSRDGKGQRSIKYEQVAEVYGDIYRSTLQNHYYKSADYDPSSGTATITWFSSVDKTEIAVELNYQDKLTGLQTDKIINIGDLGTPTQIADIDPNQLLSYRTLFLPNATAIDTFYTDFVSLQLVLPVNVALNKPTLVSGIYGSDFIGAKAVDGIIGDNTSRWVSLNTANEHWIEIDLGQEYAISSFKTWTGSNGLYQQQTVNFMFQAEVGGTWKDIVVVTGNTDPKYQSEFPEVTTSKVRYYVPPYANNIVRLYEIEVYAKIKV